LLRDIHNAACCDELFWLLLLLAASLAPVTFCAARPYIPESERASPDAKAERAGFE
jgi:hypothetical protein